MHTVAMRIRFMEGSLRDGVLTGISFLDSPLTVSICLTTSECNVRNSSVVSRRELRFCKALAAGACARHDGGDLRLG